MRLACPLWPLIMICGCTTYHEADFSKAIALEDFEWNGRIQARCTKTWLLDTPGIDRVELTSTDGRSILIVSEGDSIRAYMEIQVTETPPSRINRSTDGMQAIETRETD